MFHEKIKFIALQQGRYGSLATRPMVKLIDRKPTAKQIMTWIKLQQKYSAHLTRKNSPI